MKNNTLFQLCNLLALVTIITITTIGTTAQIAMNPETKVNRDTTRQKNSLNSFNVHLKPD